MPLKFVLLLVGHRPQCTSFLAQYRSLVEKSEWLSAIFVLIIRISSLLPSVILGMPKLFSTFGELGIYLFINGLAGDVWYTCLSICDLMVGILWHVYWWLIRALFTVLIYLFISYFLFDSFVIDICTSRWSVLEYHVSRPA